MVRYLSDEWFAAMDASLAGTTAVPAADGALVLQQVVTGAPDGDISYRVHISDGQVRMLRGTGPADVTITADYDTAAALHEGRLTLQDAFQAGRVKVGGNVATLVARQSLLTGLGPFASPSTVGS